MSARRSETNGRWVVRECPHTIGDYDVLREELLPEANGLALGKDEAIAMADLANQRDDALRGRER